MISFTFFVNYQTLRRWRNHTHNIIILYSINQGIDVASTMSPLSTPSIDISIICEKDNIISNVQQVQLKTIMYLCVNDNLQAKYRGEEIIFKAKTEEERAKGEKYT